MDPDRTGFCDSCQGTELCSNIVVVGRASMTARRAVVLVVRESTEEHREGQDKPQGTMFRVEIGIVFVRRLLRSGDAKSY